ncbi:hypothetical protein GCM10009639_45340 [Kitasatospora putterlickiae]|uniref:Uncharacterized protein n=1 Tax=Kitasatospora putterlickiae TaxID=221725 RepID=A0ABP4IYC8_9ACTN
MRQGAGMAGERLIAAVRGGDANAVRALLEDGADPDTVDERGTPVLCLAIAAFDEAVADELVLHGADPVRRLPDGTTPQLRAVDSGSIGLTLGLLGEVSLLGEATRAELLARARHWHERGPVAVLRERTGSSGAVERERVRDAPWFTEYHELRLGGMTVRDGHTGILTLLEARFGIRPGVEELAGRAAALEHPDWDHASWQEITSTLVARQDDETWEAAAALRAHRDPLFRRFGAGVLFFLGSREPFEQRGLEFLLDWVTEEEHPEVLAEVLCGLGEHDDPRIEPLGLAHLTHRAAVVRRVVPSILGAVHSERSGRRAFTADGLNALLVLTGDTDAAVRRSAGYVLSESMNPDPVVGDTLVGLLDDEDQYLRIWAVHGLAERDDPRCVEGADRVGPVDDPAAWSWILDAPARYEQRRGEREAPAAG